MSLYTNIVSELKARLDYHMLTGGILAEVKKLFIESHAEAWGIGDMPVIVVHLEKIQEAYDSAGAGRSFVGNIDFVLSLYYGLENETAVDLLTGVLGLAEKVLDAVYIDTSGNYSPSFGGKLKVAFMSSVENLEKLNELTFKIDIRLSMTSKIFNQNGRRTA